MNPPGTGSASFRPPPVRLAGRPGRRGRGNYATMVSPHGAAAVNGALGMFGNTSLLIIRNSTISGNTATAASTTAEVPRSISLRPALRRKARWLSPCSGRCGSASIQGAGIFNDGLLNLIDDDLHRSAGAAHPSGHGRNPQLADREPRLHGARRRPVHEVTGHHHPQALADRAQHPRPVLRLLRPRRQRRELPSSRRRSRSPRPADPCCTAPVSRPNPLRAGQARAVRHSRE